MTVKQLKVYLTYFEDDLEVHFKDVDVEQPAPLQHIDGGYRTTNEMVLCGKDYT